MKKYFAKYLPVDGEIKKGDEYINSEIKVGEPTYGKIYIGLPLVIEMGHKGVGYKDKDYFRKYMRKVKLFLCSRDIQVGDEFKDGETSHICSRITDIIIDKKGEWHNKKHLLK